MGRTNVVIDDELIAKVMRLYGLRTKREAVDLALRQAVAKRQTLLEQLIALRETADPEWWERHFEAIRHHKLGE
jgi:Arc/MetJ family transcription regulator